MVAFGQLRRGRCGCLAASGRHRRRRLGRNVSADFGAHGELKLESQRPRIPLWIKILLAMLNLAILGTVFAAFLRSQLKPELESFLMAEAREGYDVEDVARLHHADAASGRINKYNPRHHSLQGKGFISSPSFESFRQLRFQ